jgi:hypothetical protein
MTPTITKWKQIRTCDSHLISCVTGEHFLPIEATERTEWVYENLCGHWVVEGWNYCMRCGAKTMGLKHD